jgi:hypothetical protein
LPSLDCFLRSAKDIWITSDKLDSGDYSDSITEIASAVNELLEGLNGLVHTTE